MKNLTAALLVLILAWAVGSTFKNLGAGLYISTGALPLHICIFRPCRLKSPVSRSIQSGTKHFHGPLLPFFRLYFPFFPPIPLGYLYNPFSLFPVFNPVVPVFCLLLSFFPADFGMHIRNSLLHHDSSSSNPLLYAPATSTSFARQILLGMFINVNAPCLLT